MKRQNLFLNSNQRLRPANDRKQYYTMKSQIGKETVLKLEITYHSNRLCKQAKAVSLRKII